MKPLFCAEIGLNHHGNLSKAFRMISLAKSSGAQIAKFQYYNALDLLGANSPYLEYAQHCFFTKQQHERLKKYCDEIGIEYLVSVFDIKDIPWMNSLCSRIKVATRMNQDLEFLHYIDECKKPVIMSIQPETTVRSMYRDRFYFMWCVPQYPSIRAEVLASQFSYKYGLSSHCPDYTATVDAYVKGARLFENHVAEKLTETGCDIPASITFEDYKRMTDEVHYLDSTLATH